MLQRFIEKITGAILPVAQALGGPGIALIAFLDSSFLTFPEVSDALIVVLTVAHPHRWFYYGAMATAGSTIGCLALYALARKGGEAILSRWVKPATKDRLFALFKRYGLLTIVLGSLAPPPVPFKPFVILAGVTGVPSFTFGAVVAASRGLRYIGEAWLARLYGEQALQYIHQNAARVSMVIAVLFLVAGVAFLVWKRTRPGYNRPSAQ